MTAIRSNLVIEQGATGPTPRIFTWHNPRLVFSATVAGTSDSVEPVWPSSNCDCDNIVDNTVTWECVRTATRGDWDGSDALSLWCPDKAYSAGDTIISPEDPVDLTGYSARMQIRDKEADESDSSIYLTLTDTIDGDGNGIYLGDAAGTIELVIQAETSDDFGWEEAAYDLELVGPADPPKFPNGFVTRLLYGTITVTKEHTRT